MSNYRRVKIEGAWYFFTVVTYKRRNFLTDDDVRPMFKEALRRVKTDRPFEMPVFCLLPDHLHCIWKMPSGDADYSTRWSLIKRIFSKAYLAAGGRPLAQTDSRRKKREVGIWQRRFWEHRIRDEDDYCQPCALYSLQPGQAWLGRAVGGLAVFDVSSVLSKGRV